MEEVLPSDFRNFLIELNKKLEPWLSIAGVKQEPRDLCGFRSCRGLSRAEGEGQFGPCRGPSERSDAELLV